MRWRGGRRSTNVEDRRGQRPRAGRGVKLSGGLILVVIVLAWLTGENPLQLLSVLEETQSPTAQLPSNPTPRSTAARDEQANFVSVVLADTEDTWTPLFAGAGRRYEPPVLVLFDDAVQSACGFNSAAVGPFYCPADHQVYIDLGFFRQLDALGAPGDFAQAYVIAHEVGHHVQNLLGVSNQVHRQRARMSKSAGNALAVRLELQADCFAGVWGHHAERARNVLERGDVEEGLAAAAAIGDDRLQRRAGAVVRPESWTHGSSQQRVEWFRSGLEHGRMELCDTFGNDRP